jgi:hypothetical protein
MTLNPNLGTQNVFNMTLPSAPVIVPQSADFRSTNEMEVDLSPLIDKGNIDFISGAFVDNSASGQPLTIQVAGSQQKVIWPAGFQGYLPLLAPNAPKFAVSCPVVPGVIIPIIFYNVPLLPWLTDTTNSGSVSGSLTDYSASLTGGDDVLVTAGQASNYFLLQNPAGNGPVTLNLAGGDATSSGIVIAAGGSYESAGGISNAINVSGTASDNVVCFAG